MAQKKPLVLDTTGANRELDTAVDTLTAASLPVMVGDSGSGGTKGAVPAPAAGDSGKFLKGDGTWAAGGSGAPTDAQYLTLATNATLSAERVFTAGANITGTDAGAGSTYTLDAFGGTESPSQITSDQDNYTPTNWTTKTTFRVSSDSTMRAITGFDDLPDGTVRKIINTGAAPLYIPCEHPDSTAANRVMGSTDHIVHGNGGCLTLRYDGTSSRWRAESNTFNPALPGVSHKGHYYHVSVGATTGADHPQLGLALASGANGTTAGTATLPGGYDLNSSSSATGVATIYLSKTILNPTYFSSAHIVYSTIVSVNTLSDGTNTFTVQAGLIPSSSSTTLAVNNSVGIRYSHGTNSGKWEGFSRDNAGAESTADLGTTVATGTAYMLTICVDKAKTEIRFYLDGVYAGRVTANLPNSVAVGARVGIFKSVGTASRGIVVPGMTLYSVYS